MVSKKRYYHIGMIPLNTYKLHFARANLRNGSYAYVMQHFCMCKVHLNSGHPILSPCALEHSSNALLSRVSCPNLGLSLHTFQ